MQTPLRNNGGSVEKPRNLRSDSVQSSLLNSTGTGSSAKRGRPPGPRKQSLKREHFNSREKNVSPTKKNRLSADIAKEKLCMKRKDTVGHLSPPLRSGQVLSDYEILGALRVIYNLRLEREELALQEGNPEESVERVDDLMSCAVAYTGISKRKLYELWGEWSASY